MEYVHSKCKVCVTGGSGYVASWLIKKLLCKGYSVHATLRSLADKEKVGLLKNLAGAEARLELYEADLYKPHTFEPAIRGCDFVFHIATSFQHLPNSQGGWSGPQPAPMSAPAQYKDTIKAVVEATKSIVRSCIRAGSVKRLIYIASVLAASPLKEDGSGFKNSMDESCWSPLNLSVPLSNDFLKAYLDSKTLSEKELLNHEGCTSQEDYKRMEVVTLACGLIGGDTLLPYVPDSISVLLGTTTCLPNNNDNTYQALRYLEELLGKVPIVHIEDVCEALVFCMEHPSMCGRYLCASSYVQVSETNECYKRMHPKLLIKHEDFEGLKRDIRWGGTKLIEKGFVYKYDLKMTLEDSIKTAKKLGEPPS